VNGTIKNEMAALLPRLQRFARSLTNSTDEADDLVQSTMERGLDRVDRKHPAAPLDRWLFRVMKNIRFNQLAKRTEALLKDGDVDGLHGENHSLDGIKYCETRLTLNAVLQAFAQLSEQHREVLYLVCVEGFAYKETGKILDVPIGTVMSRLARARVALHDLLDEPRNKEASDLIHTQVGRG
jgi:RNA polymerase sigma-70 factor (ECF subfamily)